MNKKLLLTVATFVGMFANSAFAGSSATTLVCSSESGKTVISGYLPGQGEVDIRLNVSIEANLYEFSNLEQYGYQGTAKATVKLSAKNKKVEIMVKDKNASLVLVSASPETTKLTGDYGTEGSFIGLLTGQNDYILQPKTAIKVRCFVSDAL